MKQHGADDFKRIESTKPITLITPEPTGEFYKEHEVANLESSAVDPLPSFFAGTHAASVPLRLLRRHDAVEARRTCASRAIDDFGNPHRAGRWYVRHFAPRASAKRIA